MALLSAKLDQYEWRFHEKGMIDVWNELKRFANSAGEGGVTTVGSGYGSSDYATHCSPDIVEAVSRTTPIGFADVQSGPKNGGQPPTQSQA